MVRIVAVDLFQITSAEYVLLWPADGSGTNYNAYNGSRYGGANVQIDTGSSNSQYITVSVTNETGSVTYCRDTDYV